VAAIVLCALLTVASAGCKSQPRPAEVRHLLEPLPASNATWVPVTADLAAASLAASALAAAHPSSFEEARQRLAVRTCLPELCFSSAPSFLVSERRKALYARGSISLLGRRA
jgi:hypothetical protein